MGEQRGFQKRKFRPRNPGKYIGNRERIVLRSSWEKAYAVWCDNNPCVLNWSSEEVVVPYISPIDNSEHRYFIDFWVRYLDHQGQVRERLIEIKPAGQMYRPKNKNSRSYEEQVKTFLINQAKWEAAERFAKSHGWDFKVLNEYDLGLGRARG